jgi:hypothetical protein
MELITNTLNAVGFIAQVLGFLALYAIAIALIDWRRFEKQKHKN